MDKHNQISSFKDTFKGKQEEPVDKIYFRQKDEINQYSEAYFKSKHILSSKKWKMVNPKTVLENKHLLFYKFKK